MIEAKFESSKEAGACNACARYTAPEGSAEHEVLVISLSKSDARSTSFQICRPCLTELQKALLPEHHCFPAPDEPYFQLVARDALSTSAINRWVEAAARAGVRPEKLQGAQRRVQEILEWQSKHGSKLPD